MEDLLQEVRRYLDPAYAFVINNLRLLAEAANVGALAVWFGGREIQVRSLGMSPQERESNRLAALVFERGIGPDRNSAFCTRMRLNTEADDRCRRCDAKWIRWSQRHKRSHIYACHAGLAEIIVPIMVRGRVVGQMMAGQLVYDEYLPHGFDSLWKNISDIPGLSKKELAKAYLDLGTTSTSRLTELETILNTAATSLGKLFESIADLVAKEKQLGQMRAYQERVFVESVLRDRALSEDEAINRSRLLGFRDPPTVVLVAQIDYVDRNSFGVPLYKGHDIFSQLIEAANQSLMESAALVDSRDAIVSSVQPDELVLVLNPRRSRNPQVLRLRLQELVERIRSKMREHTGIPIRIGTGINRGTIAGLAESYREARIAAGYESLLGNVRDTELVTRLVEDMVKATRLIDDCLRNIPQGDLDSVLQMQLRAVATYPDSAWEARRMLFSHVMLTLLRALLDDCDDIAPIEALMHEYVQSHASLRTIGDILAWFHANFGAIRHELDRRHCAPRERLMARACEMVADSLQDGINRKKVAENLGMSDTYFGKVFRQHVGMTFREYVHRVRIATSQKLLLDPSRSIAHVAAEVGYSSSIAFAKAFEQLCGVLPGAYRRDPGSVNRISVAAKRA